MASFLQELDAIQEPSGDGFFSQLDAIPDSEVPASQGKSETWKQAQEEETKRAAQFGLPPIDNADPEVSTSFLRLQDAVKRTKAAGYDFPSFIDTDAMPDGDRAPSMDIENLTKALRQQEQAAFDAGKQEEAMKIGAERAYWEDNLKTSGMTAEEWKAQTGENDPVYPQVIPPSSGFESLANSVIRGFKQGQAAVELKKDNPNPELVSSLQEEVKFFPASKEYGVVWNDKVPASESWQAFKQNPVGSLAELIGESLGTQARTTAEYLGKIPERTMQGLGAGVIAGIPAGPAGMATGGTAGLAVGATTGVAEAQTLASYAAEYGGSIIQSLQEEGVDVSNMESLQSALQDPQKMTRIRAKANSKAVPISIIDGALAAIGGKLFANTAKTVLGRAGQWATELGVQAVGGMGGEAVSQLTSEGEITSPRSIIAEGAAEVVSSVPEVAIGRIASGVSSVAAGQPTLAPSNDPQVRTAEEEIKLRAEAMMPSRKSGLDQFIETGTIETTSAPNIPTEPQGDERFSPPVSGEIPGTYTTTTRTPRDPADELISTITTNGESVYRWMVSLQPAPNLETSSQPVTTNATLDTQPPIQEGAGDTPNTSAILLSDTQWSNAENMGTSVEVEGEAAREGGALVASKSQREVQGVEEFQPHNFQVDDSQDILDVANGKKPIALAPVGMPANQAAARYAEIKGMVVENDGRVIIVYPPGNENLAKALEERRNWARENLADATPEEVYNYHKEVGTIFGYPQKEVEQYASRERDRRIQKQASNEVSPKVTEQVSVPEVPTEQAIQEPTQTTTGGEGGITNEAPPITSNTPQDTGTPAPQQPPQSTPESVPKTPQRVQLRSGPQTFTVVEELPQSEAEVRNNEKFFRVRNERSGEDQVVEQGDMKPVGKKKIPKESVTEVDALSPESQTDAFTQASGMRPPRQGEAGFVDVSVIANGIQDVGRQIAQTTRDFTQWAAEMASIYGTKINEFLRGIYNAINTGGISYINGRERAAMTVPLVQEYVDTVQRNIPRTAERTGQYEVSPIAQTTWGTIIEKGQLPPSMRDLYEKVPQRIQGVRARFRDLTNDLKRAVNALDKTKAGREAQYSRIQQALTQEGLEISDLDSSLQLPATNLRNAIDTLSQYAIDQTVVQGPMADAFKAGIGNYMRRGYYVFDPEAGWNYGFLQSKRPDILADARTFLKAENPSLNASEIEATIKSILNRDTATTFMLTGQHGLGKNVKSLIKRKEIAEPIRKLLGEIENPLVNAARSGDFLAQLLARHELQTEFRDMGLTNGILSTEQDSSHSVELVGEGTTKHDVLKGLWTQPEFQRAFSDVEQLGLGGAVRSVLDFLGKGWLTANAIAKVSKTILNPGSFAPNYIGAFLVEVANGRVHPGNLDTWRDSINSIFTARNSPDAFVKSLKKVGIKSARELYYTLLRNGIIDQNIEFQDLKTTVERSFLKDRPVGRGIEKVAGLYAVGDNIGKANAFIYELQVLKEAFPSASTEELVEQAAEKTRNTTTTYDTVPKIIQDLSRAGLGVQSFVNFTYSMFRSAAYTAYYGVQELKSGNPVLMRRGAYRLTSLMTVIAASTPWAAGLLSQIWTDVDDEEDYAFRRSFAPPWDRDSSLFYTDFKDGKVTYSNLSYLNPYALITEPVQAVMEGETPEEAANGAARTLLGNFVDWGLLTRPAFEALMNNKVDGGQVYNSEQPNWKKIMEGGGYVYKRAFQPGVVNSAQRIYQGLTGEQGDYGTTYSAKDEALKVLGYRARSYDVRTTLPFKVSDLNQRYLEAERIQRSAENKGWKGERLQNEIKTSEQAKADIMKEYQTIIEDAETLGISRAQIGQTFKDTKAQLEVRQSLGFPTKSKKRSNSSL